MAIDWIDRRTLWKDHARALRLHLREHFRVAVDGRRRWPEITDHSVTLRRWSLRFQTLFGGPAPSSDSPPTKFYYKRVGKDIGAIDDSVIVRVLQALAVPIIGNACHVFMHGLNHIQIYGGEKLHEALLRRPQGKPLITVSNHVASIDDPFVIASLLPPSVMLDARNLRWTMCATDRCFKSPMLSAFFRCVKVLPVSRGDGIYQKGMDMALSKLNDGGWVHIFPEGSRSRDGGKTLGSAKRGVGRLVMDADTLPVVIPIAHTGMQDIMPVGTSFPKIGKKVTVLVGDPIYLDDLIVDKEDIHHVSRGVLYDAVSSRIGHRLQQLKTQVDRLALEHTVVVQDCFIYKSKRGYQIWQHADWEAFGMENFMLTEEAPKTPNQLALDQPKQILDRTQEESAYRATRIGFLYEGSIVSRVRGYMNPPEFMGFSVRGLFMNSRITESRRRMQEVNPFKAWRQFLADSGFQNWNI